jgi:hypothetical protein
MLHSELFNSIRILVLRGGAIGDFIVTLRRCALCAKTGRGLILNCLAIRISPNWRGRRFGGSRGFLDRAEWRVFCQAACLQPGKAPGSSLFILF